MNSKKHEEVLVAMCPKYGPVAGTICGECPHRTDRFHCRWTGHTVLATECSTCPAWEAPGLCKALREDGEMGTPHVLEPEPHCSYPKRIQVGKVTLSLFPDREGAKKE